MSRYIDADALKANCDIMVGNTTIGRRDYVMFHEIDSAPSIDIVICKECKWGKPYSDKQLECDALGLGGLKFPYDFCSYGERREP